jgi:type VI secretion system secreted protein VgrG
MAGIDPMASRLSVSLPHIAGLQKYVVDVPGTASSHATSVISFEAVERLGEPYTITIELTHPEALLRTDYLGKDASFTMTPREGEPRTWHGCMTQFSLLSTTRDIRIYRVVIQAHIARLALVRSSRVFQHKTAPEIIEAMLRHHGFLSHQFMFKLRRDYPQHAWRLQYQTDDWHYIRVLMEQEGIYCYVLASKDGDVLVFADDIDHYLYQPTLTLPYREPSGLASNTEAILSLQTHVHTVPQSFRVADYNPSQAWERFQAEANIAYKDTTTYGQSYVYGTGHPDQTEAQWEAQLRHEAVIAWQLLYVGESTSPALCPARILHTDDVLPDAPRGQVIIEVVHTGARDRDYRNTFKAIPADRRFRLPLNEASWPKIIGTLSARITSPNNYDYASITKDGYYTVRLDLDFDPWNPGGESVPLRLAKPYAGARQTGMHFPVLDGTEAVIECHYGDPNKPYIAAFHHDSQRADLVTNQDRWLSRNVIRTPSDNKLEMEDWEGQEHLKLSTPHSGKSQLTLGHLVDGKRQARGAGFELRTSAKGALRAGDGFIASTYDQPNARGAHTDMQQPMQQLQSAQTQMAELALVAAQARADAADAKAMNTVLQAQVQDLKAAVMVFAAKSSIALSTPDTILHSAGRDVTVTAGQDTSVSVLRRFLVTAGEAISLLANTLGIKLFAAKGPVDIQAQNDAMALAALKDLTLTSLQGKLILTAKDEVWLGAGGSYIKITATGIECASPGDIVEKCAQWDRRDPDSQLLKSTLPWTSQLPDEIQHGAKFSG